MSRASAGARPCSIRARVSGPREGRVMFCVETAPTPGNNQGQRAPTAILEELMAMPN
ncbi:hypothetical protein D3C75_1213320 [compost metagenome]